jgi:tetratricopeptide (TPR) repeat protein
VDPNNPIVLLCVKGIEAEQQGQMAEAHRCYEEAWRRHTTDFEGCVAAHYLARTQDTEPDRLRWNTEALARADLADPEATRTFYPSLLLNLGRSHEVLGNIPEARRCFELAAGRLDEIQASPLGEMTRFGISKALERVKVP